MCAIMGVTSVLEDEKFLRRNIKRGGDIKQSGQRQRLGDVGCLQVADINRGQAGPFRQSPWVNSWGFR